MSDKKPLVGSVFERKPGSSVISPPSPKSNESATGFPRALHRSKSLFAQKRGTQQQSVIPSHTAIPPVVQRAPRTQVQEEHDTDNWRVQMSEENERRVAAMTEEEREQERRQIRENFGKNIGDILKKARMAREAQTVTSLEGDSIPPGSYTSQTTIFTDLTPLKQCALHLRVRHLCCILS
jgi:RNA polymerase II-associated protein 1